MNPLRSIAVGFNPRLWTGSLQSHCSGSERRKTDCRHRQRHRTSTVRRYQRKLCDCRIPFANTATVFEYDGKNWESQGQLIPHHEGHVGWSVAISGDNLIIGVPRANAGADASGSAFIFTRKARNWVQQAKLGADDPTKADNFGYSVAIDRNTAIVGVPKGR